jgi:hypothetical protein
MLSLEDQCLPDWHLGEESDYINTGYVLGASLERVQHENDVCKVHHVMQRTAHGTSQENCQMFRQVARAPMAPIMSLKETLSFRSL